MHRQDRTRAQPASNEPHLCFSPVLKVIFSPLFTAYAWNHDIRRTCGSRNLVGETSRQALDQTLNTPSERNAAVTQKLRGDSGCEVGGWVGKKEWRGGSVEGERESGEVRGTALPTRQPHHSNSLASGC